MGRYILIGIILYTAAFFNTAYAGNAELMELINILRDNGTITHQQHDKLKQAVENGTQEAMKGKIDNGNAQKAEKDSGVDIKVSTKGGLEVATYDGNFSFELGGRLFIDGAYYNEDKNSLGDGTEFRKARLELEGTIFGDWDYEFEIDFADGDVEIKDAYFRYNDFWPTRITVGQFKEPFSLEEITSSKFITFMERSLPNEFVPGRNIGIGVHTHGEVWTAAGGMFGEAFDDDTKDEGDEGWDLTGRMTYAPLHSDTRVLHFGAAASYRDLDDEKTVKFNARPESHVTDVKFVDTGKIKNTYGLIKYGLETAVVLGPFSLQGEYIRTGVCRDDGAEDVDFDGWYLYGSWFLTGESRHYKFKKGAFGRVKPSNKSGALELALRYSTIDLNDDPITGGEEKNITFGLNWYLNPQLRFMFNYIMVDNDENADADGDLIGDDDPRIFQTRFQIDF